MRKFNRLIFVSFSFLCMLLLSTGIVYSQGTGKELKGIVKTNDGRFLEKVTVLVKGTSTGTVTDSYGRFSLKLQQSTAKITLSFTHTGYSSKELEVEAGREIEITLSESTENLDEVVVIGYGTAKRKDVTGAIVSVQTEKLEKEAPRSVQDLLRGNAAGLVIGQGNSAKGDADLLVRGKGTLKAGSSPLNVVDGVIFDGTFADLNPNDIQSIDILKDASATAVYGAKAANGVILITTKKGKKGKPTITFNGNFGMVENAGMPRVMTADEFLKYRYDFEVGRRTADYLKAHPEMFVDPRLLNGINQLDWYNYDQKTPVTNVTEDQLIRSWLSRLELKTPEIENYMNNKITDWQDLVFQKGIQQDYALAVSNSNEVSNYYLSFNHVDREGVISGNRFRNFRTRLNLETKITPYLKVGANTNFAVRNEGFLQADWKQSAVISPYGSNNIDDPTSIYQRLPTGDVTPVNPFFDNQFRDRKDHYNTLNSSLYGVITLPFGIELQSNFTPSFIWHEYYNHDSSKNPEWKAKGGSSERSFEKTYNWQLDNVLRWKRRFDVHNFEVTLLQNAEKGQYWRTKATASQFVPSDVLGWHRLQAGTIPLNESEDTYRTGDALMGRLFYSFKDRYMLTASVRRDGYSAFGAQNPRATFPALAFAWDFTAEDFMKNTKSWLDYGKLRLSWGRNGNRDIGMYEALSDMTSGLHPYIDASGNLYLSSQLYVNRMANLGLKWENKSSYNAGLDFSIFHGRLSGALDFYTAKTQDLLVDRALPEIIGFNSVAANLGELSNKGFDITLNSNIMKRGDFSWNATAIFMLNRRKIVKLYGDMVDVKDSEGNIVGQKEADDVKNRWFIGQDPDRIWAYKRNGIWQLGEEETAAKYGNQPGDFKYVDQNGDGVLTDADRVFQGYTTPRFRWSFRNELRYKELSFSFFMYSNWGHFAEFNRAANNSNFADRSTDYALPRWTPDNPINDYARIGSKNNGTNYINKSYIRLENIVLSYSVPKTLLQALKIQQLRVSASVRNVAYLTKDWRFGDPEASGDPTPRTYNLSLNLTL
ncbi:SusC/RagA family TonB-linked outer membrane protein [Sphingobacterium paramultivorum]|uniref:SusC/RagA family TonB-linked outer membrane protein n=1 Tax=Sphingobacterium paramultivorum TaxID=2886510 RepID=A0A7G5E309_9SPHI|nr:SusC/RagA family TonB-linked outer membrane protein [Sphingobacterium paramultivorum]QMV68384.1 SusC/RagA family TonB-linked outer membrane protein [Sphingobacterium paramultivorum]WSO17313.1 SusC/RagA family TonB-linked outer membrane protein [Sphingobacterium paramultivorum]